MANVSSSNGIEKYPQLRFNGYSNPWTTQKLGNLGTFIKGAPLSKADISDEGNPFILYGELYTTYSEVTHSVKRKTAKTVEQQFYSKIGDVIMPTSGETPEDIATASCIMLPDVILAGDLLIYRTEQIDGRFVSYAIKNKVNKQISSVAQGKSVVHVRADELAKICITFPALDEQKKILNLLELLDTRIATQQSLIETLKKYKRGVINKLINEVLLEGIPQIFAELVTIQRGGSPRPIDDYITDDTDGINWIKIGDVSADSLYITKTKERIKPSGVKKSRKVYPGDLILSNSMSFGRPYIMKIDGCIHDGWLLIRDEKELFDKKFLCYYLASDNIMAQYRCFAAGSCVSNLNSDLVGNLQIVLPSLEQQKKCASIFEQFDMYVTNATKQYDLLRELKQGLLQQLFI